MKLLLFVALAALACVAQPSRVPCFRVANGVIVPDTATLTDAEYLNTNVTDHRLRVRVYNADNEPVFDPSLPRIADSDLFVEPGEASDYVRIDESWLPNPTYEDNFPLQLRVRWAGCIDTFGPACAVLPNGETRLVLSQPGNALSETAGLWTVGVWNLPDDTLGVHAAVDGPPLPGTPRGEDRTPAHQARFQVWNLAAPGVMRIRLIEQNSENSVAPPAPGASLPADTPPEPFYRELMLSAGGVVTNMLFNATELRVNVTSLANPSFFVYDRFGLFAGRQYTLFLFGDSDPSKVLTLDGVRFQFVRDREIGVRHDNFRGTAYNADGIATNGPHEPGVDCAYGKCLPIDLCAGVTCTSGRRCRNGRCIAYSSETGLAEQCRYLGFDVLEVARDSLRTVDHSIMATLNSTLARLRSLRTAVERNENQAMSSAINLRPYIGALQSLCQGRSEQCSYDDCVRVMSAGNGDNNDGLPINTLPCSVEECTATTLRPDYSCVPLSELVFLQSVFLGAVSKVYSHYDWTLSAAGTECLADFSPQITSDELPDIAEANARAAAAAADDDAMRAAAATPLSEDELLLPTFTQLHGLSSNWDAVAQSALPCGDRAFDLERLHPAFDADASDEWIVVDGCVVYVARGTVVGDLDAPLLPGSTTDASPNESDVAQAAGRRKRDFDAAQTNPNIIVALASNASYTKRDWQSHRASLPVAKRQFANPLAAVSVHMYRLRKYRGDGYQLAELPSTRSWASSVSNSRAGTPNPAEGTFSVVTSETRSLSPAADEHRRARVVTNSAGEFRVAVAKDAFPFDGLRTRAYHPHYYEQLSDAPAHNRPQAGGGADGFALDRDTYPEANNGGASGVADDARFSDAEAIEYWYRPNVARVVDRPANWLDDSSNGVVADDPKMQTLSLALRHLPLPTVVVRPRCFQRITRDENDRLEYSMEQVSSVYTNGAVELEIYRTPAEWLVRRGGDQVPLTEAPVAGDVVQCETGVNGATVREATTNADGDALFAMAENEWHSHWRCRVKGDSEDAPPPPPTGDEWPSDGLRRSSDWTPYQSYSTNVGTYPSEQDAFVHLADQPSTSSTLSRRRHRANELDYGISRLLYIEGCRYYPLAGRVVVADVNATDADGDAAIASAGGIIVHPYVIAGFNDRGYYDPADRQRISVDRRSTSYVEAPRDLVWRDDGDSLDGVDRTGEEFETDATTGYFGPFFLHGADLLRPLAFELRNASGVPLYQTTMTQYPTATWPGTAADLQVLYGDHNSLVGKLASTANDEWRSQSRATTVPLEARVLTENSIVSFMDGEPLNTTIALNAIGMVVLELYCGDVNVDANRAFGNQSNLNNGTCPLGVADYETGFCTPAIENVRCRGRDSREFADLNAGLGLCGWSASGERQGSDANDRTSMFTEQRDWDNATLFTYSMSVGECNTFNCRYQVLVPPELLPDPNATVAEYVTSSRIVIESLPVGPGSSSMSSEVMYFGDAGFVRVARWDVCEEDDV